MMDGIVCYGCKKQVFENNEDYIIISLSIVYVFISLHFLITHQPLTPNLQSLSITNFFIFCKDTIMKTFKLILYLKN